MKSVHSFQQIIKGVTNPQKAELNFSSLCRGGERFRGIGSFSKPGYNIGIYLLFSSALPAFLLRSCHIYSMLLSVNYCSCFLWDEVINMKLKIWFLTIFVHKNLNANGLTQCIKARIGWALLRCKMKLPWHYSSMHLWHHFSLEL